MGRHAQLVMGPAGSGKSTYCRVMQDYCDTIRRVMHVINLDPACEAFAYNASADVRELVTVDDVAEEQALGPNGGLVYAMEYLIDSPEWLDETLGDYADDYVLFDLPGQIELFTHIPVLPRLAKLLQDRGFHVAGVYLMDSSVVLTDTAKYVSGTLTALSAMLLMEIPHINVLSKIDITREVEGAHDSIDDFLECEWERMLADPKRREQLPGRLLPMTAALGNLLSQFPLVAYHPLDISSIESVVRCLMEVDRMVQYEDDDDLLERRRDAVERANEQDDSRGDDEGPRYE